MLLSVLDSLGGKEKSLGSNCNIISSVTFAVHLHSILFKMGPAIPLPVVLTQY